MSVQSIVLISQGPMKSDSKSSLVCLFPWIRFFETILMWGLVTLVTRKPNEYVKIFVSPICGHCHSREKMKTRVLCWGKWCSCSTVAAEMTEPCLITVKFTEVKTQIFEPIQTLIDGKKGKKVLWNLVNTINLALICIWHHLSYNSNDVMVLHSE